MARRRRWISGVSESRILSTLSSMVWGVRQAAVSTCLLKKSETFATSFHGYPHLVGKGAWQWPPLWSASPRWHRVMKPEFRRALAPVKQVWCIARGRTSLRTSLRGCTPCLGEVSCGGAQLADQPQDWDHLHGASQRQYIRTMEGGGLVYMAEQQWLPSALNLPSGCRLPQAQRAAPCRLSRSGVAAWAGAAACRPGSSTGVSRPSSEFHCRCLGSLASSER